MGHGIWEAPGNVVLFKKMLTYSVVYSRCWMGGQQVMLGRWQPEAREAIGLQIRTK